MAIGSRSACHLQSFASQSGDPKVRWRTSFRAGNSGHSSCRWAYSCWLALLSLLLLVSLAPPAGATEPKRVASRSRSPRRTSSRHVIAQSTSQTQHTSTVKHSASDHNHKAPHHLNQGAVIEKASHLELTFLLGHKIVLVCIARGIPRPKITWLKDGVEIAGHPYVQISEWLREDNRIKSKLEIDPARQMDSGSYTCQADNKVSVDRKMFKAEDFPDLPLS
ncbi:hemicentin-1-like [Varroa jacobsoni]|uniref:hemicentin-1-like n=1 Tax=Varroa jacobsoni TaxID=62625 RepID=UPI000BF827CE|nr:hemicentin-1-like [Varroa jacobsoni]